MENRISRLLILVCIMVYGIPAHAGLPLPKSSPVPGGVAIVNLDIATSYPPEVHYQDKRTLVLRDPTAENNWLAIVGIPLDAKPGTHNLQVIADVATTTQSFAVQNKKYPQERLTIANKRKVQPLPEDLAIIEQQYLETIRTYDHWQYQDLTAITLALPVSGRKSSPFGLTRIMNNIPQNPHSGLDIAAAKGTKVKAAKDGKVINIGNFFYSGNIVFVDHGQGLITSYCHLDTVSVQKGQLLALGDVIGTVGNTGRATGPHLHWSVSLNGVRVDPQLFLHE